MRRKTAAALGRRLCRLEALAASGPRQGAADLEVGIAQGGCRDRLVTHRRGRLPW